MEAPSERTKVRRKPGRASYDAETVHAVLDEGLVAHVGVTTGEGPVVLPMAYGRVGDTLYLHGASTNALLRAGAAADVCVTVTLLDGLVLARSAFRHSMNYRCVVVRGEARAVTDEAEQLRALAAIVDHALPGRWQQVRRPDAGELRATLVVAVPLAESSAKIRTGPPLDQPADAEVPVWSGVLPLTLVRGEPVATADG